MSPAPTTSIALSWVPQGTFHHVGFVVASIASAMPGFAKSLGVAWDEVIIHDPNQGARVSFLPGQSPADPLLELVEPASEDSPVMKFLQKGGGLHHLCYETPDLDRQLELARASGGLVTRTPMPAVAFGGRRIAWVYTRNKLLIEYLERKRSGESD
jgi:methylmalonyl-CoA/ethylmalonyl-CoA epimerase